MAIRQLTNLEQKIAAAVVELGLARQWEFAAFLEGPNGPLIELITRMRDDGADPSEDVKRKASAGVPIVMHHNHLSQESLSSADWNGLSCLFSETFAHAADGTVYWGRVINQTAVKSICARAVELEMAAENALFAVLGSAPDAVDPAGFFRKEVLSRAMKQRGFVEYEVSWGTAAVTPHARPGGMQVPQPAGVIGRRYEAALDAVAADLAPSL